MSFCPNCGAPAEGRFCSRCGTALNTPPGYTPPPPPPGFPPPGPAASIPENIASAFCYVLGIITGVLFLVLPPYSRNRNIRFHAFQAIFFQIAVMVIWVAVGVVFRGLAGFVAPILSIGFFVVWILLILRAYRGEKFVLPVIGPMAERQA
jgi:uncharacterized membrane protein